MRDYASRTTTRLSCWCILGAALSVSACTKFASELDSPEGTTEGSLQPESDADWSCLTEPRGLATVAANPQRPLTYSMAVVNLISAAPSQQVQVRACFRADVTCASPVTQTFTGGSDGMVAVTVYEGFDGYLEISSEGMIPTLLFFPSAWTPALITALEQLPVSVLPAAALRGLADSARVQLDPTGGILAMSTYDCEGPRAAGVRFEIDTAGVPFAFVNNLPVAYQDVTGIDGNAGFVNVPPGIVAVSAFPDDANAQASIDTFLVRTGWVTSGRVLPRFTQ
jgi:hypothetical protein